MTEDIHRSLGRIEGKLDGVMDMIDTVRHRVQDVESDVKKVNQKVWWAGGLAMGWGAAVGLLLKVFS